MGREVTASVPKQHAELHGDQHGAEGDGQHRRQKAAVSVPEDFQRIQPAHDKSSRTNHRVTETQRKNTEEKTAIKSPSFAFSFFFSLFIFCVFLCVSVTLWLAPFLTDDGSGRDDSILP